MVCWALSLLLQGFIIRNVQTAMDIMQLLNSIHSRERMLCDGCGKYSAALRRCGACREAKYCR